MYAFSDKRSGHIWVEDCISKSKINRVAGCPENAPGKKAPRKNAPEKIAP